MQNITEHTGSRTGLNDLNGGSLSKKACQLSAFSNQLREKNASHSDMSRYYHLLLAHDLELLKTHDYEQLADDVIEVKRMLTSFIQKLRADS